MLSFSLSAIADETPEFEMKENTTSHDKEVVDGSRFYEILQAVNLKLGKTVNSSSYSYSIAEEHCIIRFNLKYI